MKALAWSGHHPDCYQHTHHEFNYDTCAFVLLTSNVLLTDHLLQPGNTFSSVVLDGLLFDGSSPVTVTLDRKILPRNLVTPMIETDIDPEISHVYVSAEDIPARRPSSMPPSAQLQLHATIGNFLGDGQSSVVFALDNVSVPGIGSDVVIPPLVAKISRPFRVGWAMREAWFYDEMECIQGSVVPYCFGYFERDVGYSLQNGATDSKSFVTAFEDHPPNQDADAEEEMFHDLAPKMHPMLEERLNRRDILSVTILERLGDMLPWHQEVPQSTQ